MSDITAPTIHLNGTAKAELHAQLSGARRALLHAVEKLKEAEPHGRDFYMHGREVFKTAQAQHISRLERIEAVYNELSELLEAVDAQGTPVSE